jgi:hypothetical protein
MVSLKVPSKAILVAAPFSMCLMIHEATKLPSHGTITKMAGDSYFGLYQINDPMCSITGESIHIYIG